MNYFSEYTMPNESGFGNGPKPVLLSQRKPYGSPGLINRGQVRDVTLGVSGFIGDSGDPLNFGIDPG